MIPAQYAFGPFVFALQTASPQTVGRTIAHGWTGNERIGAAPAWQYLGPRDDSLTLAGSLYPELTGGQLTFAALEVLARTGREWPLIQGTGRVLGLWFLEGLEATHQHLHADGSPRRIDFTLTLRRSRELLPSLARRALDAARVF